MSRPIIEDPRVERHIVRSEVISKVAGGVVHNFNNILSVLLGRVELLLGQVDRGALDEGQLRKGLLSIQKGALDAAELLKRLRDIARPPQDVACSVFDLNAAVADAVEFIQPHLVTVAQGHGISVLVTPRLSTVAVPVSGQSSALREVLVNLILNAIEAMPRGGDVTIETVREGSRAALRVTDTGVGMSEEVLTRVFTPFFTTKPAGNTGLGLSSAKDLVTSHGGTISVVSELGRGTTFTIVLPCAESRQARMAAVAAPRLRAGLRVLVVDDQRELRDILREFLSELGCQPTLVGSGKAGLETLEHESFDVVLTDLLLPGASGWEIARAAKRRSPGCRVVLMSGKAIPDGLRVEALVDASLMKPVDLGRLRAVIAGVLDESSPSLS
ncbi:MAG TPA: ATP-binding protein [Methylomirabilota bacterium]|nr:ATP-binding protein [Methylomirabilota bacterium]